MSQCCVCVFWQLLQFTYAISLPTFAESLRTMINLQLQGAVPSVNQQQQPADTQPVPQLQRQDAFVYPANPQGIDQNLDSEADDVDDMELLEWENLVGRWKRFFEDWEKRSKVTKNIIFNRRCFSFDATNVFDILKSIHLTLGMAYRLQIQAGYVLRDIRDNSLLYYWASTNTSVFSLPITILSDSDLQKAFDQIKQQDIVSKCLQKRDGSSSVFFAPVNLVFHVYSLDTFIRGITSKSQASGYFKHNRYIHSFDDKKIAPHCFFYCLESFLQDFTVNPAKISKKKVLKHTTHFCNHMGIEHFSGVRLGDLEECEKIFDVSIQVLRFSFFSHKKPTIYTIRHSERPGRRMYLGLYRKHFFLITNVERFASLYRCELCDHLSFRSDNMRKHKSGCNGKREPSFKTGNFLPKANMFSLLKSIGIQNIYQADFMNESVVTYDFEVGFNKVQADFDRNGEKLIFTDQHVPISVAVVSNVPGFENSRFFYNFEDPASLIETFLHYCIKVSDAAKVMFENKLNYIFQQLSEMEEECAAIGNLEKQRQIANVEKRLNSYISKTPIIGFNSSNYDLKAIKKYFFSILDRLDNINFCIKKDGSYLCVTSDSLRFLDIAKYLGPGSGGLASYLESYGAGSASKLFFPYSILRNAKKLTSIKKMPNYEAFNSEIAGGNTLSIDYDKYQRFIKLGLSSSAAMNKAGLNSMPLTGHENYAKVVELFKKNKCRNMLDYLKIYNLADVQPLLKAIENHQRFFFEKNIHMTRDHVTLPSLCLPFLFSFVGKSDHFCLLDQETNKLFRKNLLGGLSVIITRYAEVGVSKIKAHVYGNNSKTCRKITCKDANILYSSCLGQDMFEGPYITRKKENNFKPSLANKGSFTIQYLEYLAHSWGKAVQHALHPEGEYSFFLGGHVYFADGFFEAEKLWVEVNTCFSHGCLKCYPDREKVCPLTGKSYREIYEKSKQRTDLISKHFKVQIYWECNLKKMYRQDSAFRHFCTNFYISGRKVSQKGYSENELLTKIKNGSFFGALLCSAKLGKHYRTFYDQFPPIICRREINIDQSGPTMKNVAESLGQGNVKREQLVGCFSGEDMLLSTSMVQWLMNHNVTIYDVKQFIQFSRKQPFKKFTETIAQMRKQAEEDKDLLLSTTAKALGNSSYGFTLYSAAKSLEVKYVHADSLQKYVLSNRFVSLEELNDDYYEVTMEKNIVMENLPIQIGFQVYALSKVYMLHFIHDVLGSHLKDDEWEILASDTDSVCMSLAQDNIDDCVRPDKKDQWDEIKYKYFVDDRTPESKSKTSKMPLLFKDEIGDASSFYGLNAKCYFANAKGGPKISSKGVSKKQNVLTEKMFKETLFGNSGQFKYHSTKNYGFRYVDSNIYTYELTKNGLSPVYFKRYVMPNLINTRTIEFDN